MGVACEIFYQVCTNESRYAEFLRLPLTANVRDPLMLSVAHDIHGKQMRTGWPEHPKSIDERDEALNNMLIETTFSNFLKFDFDPRWYEDLRELVASIKVPADLYDPSAAAPTLPTIAHDVLKDANFGDVQLESDTGGAVGLHVDMNEEFMSSINAEETETISGAEMESQYKTLHDQAESLRLMQHNDVKELLDRLDGLLGTNDDDDIALLEFSQTIAKLNDYIFKAEGHIRDSGEVDLEFSGKQGYEEELRTGHAGVDAARLAMFRERLTQAMTTTMFDAAVSLEIAVATVNANIPMEVAEFADGAGEEGETMLQQLTTEGFIQYEPSTQMARRP